MERSWSGARPPVRPAPPREANETFETGADRRSCGRQRSPAWRAPNRRWTNSARRMFEALDALVTPTDSMASARTVIDLLR